MATKRKRYRPCPICRLPANVRAQIRDAWRHDLDPSGRLGGTARLLVRWLREDYHVGVRVATLVRHRAEQHERRLPR